MSDDVTVDSLTGTSPPVIMTSDVQRSIDAFNSWLHADNKQPFIVVGPDGCGKGCVTNVFVLLVTYIFLCYNKMFEERKRMLTKLKLSGLVLLTLLRLVELIS